MSQELNVYRWAVAKQTAKGTVTAAPTKSLIGVTGDIASPRDQGAEAFSDGATKFGDATDYVNSVLGNGSPGFQADCDTGAYLSWLFNGGETVSANALRATWNDHVTQPGTASGFYSTWWKKQGVSVIQRQRHADCLIGQLQVEGSTANKVLRITPTVIALDPAENLAADPTWPAIPSKDLVMIYTEAAATFSVDTVIIRGHSQFTVVLNEDLGPVFTDDVTPFEVQRGAPAATIACTLQADADGLAQWNKYMYGTSAPAGGTKPIKTLPAMGAYTFTAQKGVGAALTGVYKYEAAGVRWNMPEWPAPNPAGGNPTLAMAGNLRISGASPLWKQTWTNANVAYTV